MTGSFIDRVEMITSVQRRRRWSVEEKLRIVAESLRPGVSVAMVARRHGINANQLHRWRRLAREGSFGAPGGFVPVHVAALAEGCPTEQQAPSLGEGEPGSRSPVAEIGFPNGCCLRVAVEVEPEALAGLVATLLAAR